MMTTKSQSNEKKTITMSCECAIECLFTSKNPLPIDHQFLIFVANSLLTNIDEEKQLKN